MKQKAFFPVSQVLFFRRTKQTSKNLADTTFNKLLFSCEYPEGQLSKLELQANKRVRRAININL